MASSISHSSSQPISSTQPRPTQGSAAALGGPLQGSNPWSDQFQVSPELELDRADPKAQLQRQLPQRAAMVELARSLSTGKPEAPEGYRDIRQMPDLKGGEQLDKLLHNEQSGFLSRIYVNEEGHMLVGFAGSNDGQDMGNNLTLADGKVPEQAEDALKLFGLAETLAQDNQLQPPTAVGHSLGGFLAQLMPRGVNFNGPGAGLAKEKLEHSGAYQRHGVSPEAEKVVNVGIDSDPIFAYQPSAIGAGADSPHITGSQGDIFHLHGRPQGGPVRFGAHDDWDTLAHSQQVTNYSKGFDYTVRQTLPWVPEPEQAQKGQFFQIKTEI